MKKDKGKSTLPAVGSWPAPVIATSPMNADPWAAHADIEDPKYIVGERLAFNRGDWLIGEDRRELDSQTELLAHIDQMALGWTKWKDSRPIKTILGLVADRFHRPEREELDDRDDATWEIDSAGKRRDPWAKVDMLVLTNARTGEYYTFVTSSQGGRRALANLGRAYSHHMREFGADELPIVCVGSDSYQHQDRSIGQVKVPTFDIMSWQSKSGTPAPRSEQITSSEAVFDDAIPF